MTLDTRHLQFRTRHLQFTTSDAGSQYRCQLPPHTETYTKSIQNARFSTFWLDHYGRTDGWMVGRTDRRMDGRTYRVACPQLKTAPFDLFEYALHRRCDIFRDRQDAWCSGIVFLYFSLCELWNTQHRVDRLTKALPFDRQTNHQRAWPLINMLCRL